MRYVGAGSGPYRAALGLAIVAVLFAAVSQVDAGKGSNSKDNQNMGGSFISARVNGTLFRHTLTTGETSADARAALVALIDAHPSFVASTTTVPLGFGPNDLAWEVLLQAGGEPSSLEACETDANLLNSSVHFAVGKPGVLLLKPTAVFGDGLFKLQWVLSSAPGVVDQISDIDTSAFGGDPTGLINSIISALNAKGFTVTSIGANLQITKSGDSFRTFRVEATDTLIKHTCMQLTATSPPSAGVPTMPEYVLVLLAIALVLIAIVMIRRRPAAG